MDYLLVSMQTNFYVKPISQQPHWKHLVPYRETGERVDAYNRRDTSLNLDKGKS